MNKLALVVGSAECVYEDVAEANRLTFFDAVCCVKRMGIEWPYKFDIWAGLHPEYMTDFIARRKAKGLPGGYRVVCPPDGEIDEKHRGVKCIDDRVSYRWPGMNASAGSGIYGAKVMIDAGYRVVLAGVPMDDRPHVMNHEKWGTGKWLQKDGFMTGFELATPYLRGKCVSVSGYTKEILGGPTPEWLAGMA